MANTIVLIKQAYGHALKVCELLQSLILLVFRINWGWQFFTTGQGKLLNHQGVTEFFASLHIPLPSLNAWFVGGTECVGGLLLLLGLASRPVAFILTITMIVAYLSVGDSRATVLNIFKDPAPFLSADPFFYLLTVLLVLAFGPGMISGDSLIALFLKNKRIKTNNTP